MKKIILIILMLSSLYVFADIIVHGDQKAGEGGKSVFGKSEGGSINNYEHKDTNKTTNINTNANLFKK